MTETPTYRPQRGSLAEQLVGFFINNPDEELNIEDIANKFDCVRGNIHTLLKKAVDAGLLRRFKNDDGEYMYQRGRGKPGDQEPAEADAPAMGEKLGVVYPVFDGPIGTFDTERDRLQYGDLQVDIVYGVPLPSIREAKVYVWNDILSRVKPGGHFKIPLKMKYPVLKAVANANKTGKARFKSLTFKAEGALGVWRIA